MEILNTVSPAELEELAIQLINIESHENVEGRETNLVLWLKDYLVREGLEVQLVPVLDGRPNLIARLRGSEGRPVLLLNGHTDTIPAYNMENAFSGRIIGDRIYGRGSCDMKGALAAMVSTILALHRSRMKLRGDVMLAFTIGEEEHSAGTYHLINSGTRADYAIVGEPTNLEIGIAHKGVLWAEAVFEGRSVHGSVPEKGINAIYSACRWIEKLRTCYIPELQSKKHPLLGSPTINVGVINGGTRPTVVPNRCIVKLERRMIPGEQPETVMRELRDFISILKEEDETISGTVQEMTVFRGVPHLPFSIPSDSHIVQTLARAYFAETGRDAVIRGLTYWTDAALLAMLSGLQPVVCGPGSIEQAHSSDEWVSRKELYTAYCLYVRTALLLCGE
jgi:acetylornithine deacetylase/succinyl-diaminopimelate desuccinylase